MRLVHTLLVVACASLGACNFGGIQGKPSLEGVKREGGFAVTLPTTPPSVLAGSSSMFPIAVVRDPEVEEDEIVFTTTDAPAGLVVSGALQAHETSGEIALAASVEVGAGRYAITVHAVASAGARDEVFDVDVVGADGFSVSALPAVLSLSPGASGTASLVIARGVRFTASIAAAVQTQPDGFIVGVGTVAANDSALVSVTAASAAPGSYMAELVVFGGGVMQVTGLGLEVLMEDPVPCVGMCAPPVPAGFFGPVAMGPDDCGGGYPTLAREGLTDIVGDPATCTCDCKATPFCGKFNWLTFMLACSSAPSNGGATDFDANPAHCYPIFPDDGWVANIVASTAGTCVAEQTKSIAPSSAQTTRVCSGNPALSGACETGRSCYVATPNHLCVFADGDFACDGPYSEKTSVYAEVTDNRDCAACAACPSAPSPHTCTSLMRKFPLSGCIGHDSTTTISTANFTGCQSSTVQSVRLDPPAFTGSECTQSPTPPQPIGEASGAGAQTTVCCLP